jgi:hypothetical protein
VGGERREERREEEERKKEKKKQKRKMKIKHWGRERNVGQGRPKKLYIWRESGKGK